VRAVRPNVLTAGFGYGPDDIVGREFVEGYGGRAVVTCHGDAKDEPSTTKTIRHIVRAGDIIELCRVAAASSVNPFEKLRLMADQLVSVADLPGEVADVGAYKGGTSLVLRRLAPHKHLHLFDTWAGTPFNDDLCHHKKGEWVADLEDCKRLVGNGELTHYHQGVFPYTTPGLELESFCFAFVDPDTYQTVRDCIEWFWPRMARGGKLVFDDYNWSPCAGVKKAVDEVFSEDQRQVFGDLHTCVVVKR
jgi:hypothetical protein